jgi:hypothetical protein
MKKNQAGKSGNFKKLSIEIVKSIREKEGKSLLDIAKEIELNIGNESIDLSLQKKRWKKESKDIAKHLQSIDCMRSGQGQNCF